MTATYVPANAAKPVGVAKCTLYIGTAGVIPSSVTTWTELGSILSLPLVGASDAPITSDPINGPKIKLKGVTDPGGGSLELGADFSDAGQTAIRAAYSDKTNDYPFRYILANPETSTGTGTMIDVMGKVMSDPFDFGSGPNNQVKVKIDLAYTTLATFTAAT